MRSFKHNYFYLIQFQSIEYFYDTDFTILYKYWLGKSTHYQDQRRWIPCLGITTVSLFCFQIVRLLHSSYLDHIDTLTVNNTCWKHCEFMNVQFDFLFLSDTEETYPALVARNSYRILLIVQYVL